jgi:hypothetical protein
VWNSVGEIRLDQLPERFVIKASHGSRMNLIVTDKRRINWFIWKLIMRCWLKQDIAVEGREWVYGVHKPTLLCEKYLDATRGSLTDYKFLCAGDRVMCIQVHSNRFSADHSETYYTPEWERLEFSTGHPGIDEPKPERLDDMLALATKIAGRFPTARVDMYDMNGEILIGEITFFDSAGYLVFDPDKYDLVLGAQVRLPAANHTPGC